MDRVAVLWFDGSMVQAVLRLPAKMFQRPVAQPKSGPKVSNLEPKILGSGCLLQADRGCDKVVSEARWLMIVTRAAKGVVT